MSLTGLLGRPARPASSSRLRAGFRPMLETLEDRAVPATLAGLGIPLDVSGLHAVGDQIVGDVTFAGHKFENALTISNVGTSPAATTSTATTSTDQCPVLDLHVNALHLNLLGLHVDTSDICLDVTATNNQGLLGGLLCDLTGGLDGLGGGLNLGGILSQVDTFLDRVEDLLDGILAQATVDSVFAGSGMAASHAEDGNCDILNLSLGPVNLDVPLLGVSVDLDDCAGGPVTVDITGDPNGGLLGGLLCGLADGLGGSGISTDDLLDRVGGLIDRLGDLATRIGNIDDLGHRLEKQVEQISHQLVKAAEKVDSLADLDRFFAQVDRTVDRLDRLLDRVA